MGSISRSLSVIKETVAEFLANNCTYIAAAIAFYSFFTLFPVALGLVSAAGFILGNGPFEELAEHLGRVLPVSRESITSTIYGVVQAKGVMAIAAVVGLAWSSSAVFGAIRKGVNAAWGMRTPKPFLVERLIDFSLMAGAGLLFLLSLSSTVILRFSRELSLLLKFPSLDEHVLLFYLNTIVPPLITFIMFTCLYRILPNTKVRWRDVCIGALFATIAFEIVKNVFVWYVKEFTPYNIIYGPLGALVALLTWMYISAVVLLFGAQVSFTLSKLTNAKTHRVKILPVTRRWGKAGAREAEEDE